jgi:hypothetical protein
MGFSPPLVKTKEGRHYPVREYVKVTDLGSTGTAERCRGLLTFHIS